MTLEQAQGLAEQLNDVHKQLSNMITALSLALELFDDLPPDEKRWLQTYWQEQQLTALHQLSAAFDGCTPAPLLHM